MSLDHPAADPCEDGRVSRTRLVLFDVDGTLIDAYGAGRRALEESYAIVFGVADAAQHLDSIWFAGKTDLFIFSEVAARAGIPSRDYERRYPELEAAYLERLHASIAEHTAKRVLPGVETLLAELSGGNGLALGLMTGNLERGARIKLEPWDLNRFLPTGGFGNDARDRAEIGAVARRRFEERLGNDLDCDAVVLVGDTPHDIAAARACGFRVLAVGTGWTDKDELRAAAPDAYLDDLSDTPSAVRALGL